MDYFFGNARNDKDMCATPGCTGTPVHTFIYKYCEKCFDIIASDVATGRTPNIDRLKMSVLEAERKASSGPDPA